MPLASTIRTIAPSKGAPAAATPDREGITTGATVLVVVAGVLAVEVPEPVLVVGVVTVVVDELVVVGVAELVEVAAVLLPPPPQPPASAVINSNPTHETQVFFIETVSSEKLNGGHRKRYQNPAQFPPYHCGLFCLFLCPGTPSSNWTMPTKASALLPVFCTVVRSVSCRAFTQKVMPFATTCWFIHQAAW
jgi:hypothetical protein